VELITDPMSVMQTKDWTLTDTAAWTVLAGATAPVNAIAKIKAIVKIVKNRVRFILVPFRRNEKKNCAVGENFCCQ